MLRGDVGFRAFWRKASLRRNDVLRQAQDEWWGVACRFTHPTGLKTRFHLIKVLTPTLFPPVLLQPHPLYLPLR